MRVLILSFKSLDNGVVSGVMDRGAYGTLITRNTQIKNKEHNVI
jgi:hypothetical protein